MKVYEMMTKLGELNAEADVYITLEKGMGQAVEVITIENLDDEYINIIVDDEKEEEE